MDIARMFRSLYVGKRDSVFMARDETRRLESDWKPFSGAFSHQG